MGWSRIFSFKNNLKKKWFFAKLGARLLDYDNVGRMGTNKWIDALKIGLKHEKSLKIAKCIPMDIDQIYAIEILCFDERFRFDKIDYLHFLKSPTMYSLKIVNEKHLIGYIFWRANSRKIEILTLNIHPKYRNIGLASILLRNFEKTCKKPSEVILEVYDENYPAINLYKKFRYEESAYFEDYYGKNLNAIRMKKTLS